MSMHIVVVGMFIILLLLFVELACASALIQQGRDNITVQVYDHILCFHHIFTISCYIFSTLKVIKDEIVGLVCQP